MNGTINFNADNIDKINENLEKIITILSSLTQNATIKNEKNEKVETTQPAIAPTTTIAYSFEQIQKAAADMVRAGKREQIQKLVNSYNVKSLTEIPQAYYNDVAGAIRQLGGVL